MTIKQLIKDVINSYDPTLDTTDTSTLTDLLINPASAMLDPLIAQIKFILTNMSLESPSTMANSEVDAIGANFLVSRDPGSKSSGYVELLYTAAQNVFIPANTEFIDVTGNVFVTTKDLYIDSSTMSNNAWNFPLLSSGPIPVESLNPGKATALDPNTVFTTSLTPAPARVTNPTSFTGGSDQEDNVTYVARLIEEVVNGNIGSPSGIKKALQKNFDTIQSVQVRGMNDIEMLRDLVVSGISLYSIYSLVDFYGKVSGLSDPPFPGSLAYFTTFYDDPLTSGLLPDLPTPELFSTEFTTDQYGGIYVKDDAIKTTIKTLVVVQDDFQAPELSSLWRLGDANAGVDRTIKPTEIVLEVRNGTQKVRLGQKVTGGELNDMQITVTGRFLANIINDLKKANQLPNSASDPIPFISDASEAPGLIRKV